MTAVLAPRNRLRGETALALLCSCASSIAMTVLNKYILSEHQFRLNFFLLLVQALTTILLLCLFGGLRLISYRSLNLSEMAAWFPVSLLLVAMIYTGSKSLQYLTVAMFTVFKNATIVCTALGERRLFQSPITPLMWFSFLLIILSSVVGGLYDLTFNLPGYLWIMANCLATASYGLYMRFSIRNMDFADFDSVYYNNILAVPILFLMTILTENWSQFLKDYFGDGPLVVHRHSLFIGILCSSLAAFAISYTTAWSVRVSTSTTCSMVGALNKFPAALSGMIFFSTERRVTTWGNIFSVLIAFASGITYCLAKIRLQGRQSSIDEEKAPLTTFSTVKRPTN